MTYTMFLKSNPLPLSLAFTVKSRGNVFNIVKTNSSSRIPTFNYPRADTLELDYVGMHSSSCFNYY